MAVELCGLKLEGQYLGVRENIGKDGKKYLYAQFLCYGENGRKSVVAVRVRDAKELEAYQENELVEVMIDVQEKARKDGGTFIAVDMANGNLAVSR